MNTSSSTTSRNLTRNTFLVGVALATAASVAFAHSFLTADPSSTAEQYAWQFDAAKQAAADAAASSTTLLVAQSVYDDFLKWPFTGMTAAVTVCFWNGSDAAQHAVINTDNAEWEGYANITFDYYSAPNIVRKCADANSADIRISLDGSDSHLDYDPTRPGNGDWSFVGAQANFPPQGTPPGTRYKVTVNLPEIEGWVALNDVVDINTYAGHELGHARGLLHEHQRSECEGWFNIPQIAQDNDWTIGNGAAKRRFVPATWCCGGQSDTSRTLRRVVTDAVQLSADLVARYTGPDESVSANGRRAVSVAGRQGDADRRLRRIDAATGRSRAGSGRQLPVSRAGSVMAAPAPQRMAFTEAIARLGPAIRTERARVASRRYPISIPRSRTADSSSRSLPHAAQVRAQGTLQHYRAVSVTANKSKALSKAMDDLEAAAAQLTKLKQGQ